MRAITPAAPGCSSSRDNDVPFSFFFCRGVFQGVKCVGRSNQIPLEKSPRDSGIVFFFFKGKARTTPKEVNIALAVTNEAH